MSYIIGIDLGTTNSCAAFINDDNQAEVIPNERKETITPSVVAFTENGEILVGESARRQAASNPDYTIFSSKRLIGRQWGSEIAKKAISSINYYCKEGPNNDIRLVIRGQEISLPEISSHILKHIKELAEKQLGDTIEQAVITVPAYFNDNQRQATKDAGALANLEVIRIINEPTAAALAAGVSDQNITCAIYDLGGGTFDVSILHVEESVFEVLASSGDSFLGGVDFNNRILHYLADEFYRDEQIDLREHSRSLQRLSEAVEKAKIDLSTRESAHIYLPFIFKDGNRTIHFNATLQRSQIEELCLDLVEKTLEICQETLNEAALTKDDLDTILMVGGMTRMPLVQAQVREFFGKAIDTDINPDHAVALGAALQGSIIEDDSNESVLLDVTSQDLGIRVLGGLHEVLIPKNTTIPTSEKKIFHTVRDNQIEVRIVILQGDSKKADDNELLGEFALTGLRMAPRGEVRVEVTFEIDADGILSVQARDLDTGQEQSIVVNAHTGLSNEEIDEIQRRNEQYLPSSELAEAFERQRREAEEVLYQIDQLISWLRASLGDQDTDSHPVVKITLNTVGNIRDAIDKRDQNAVEELLPSLRRSHELLNDTVSQVTTV